MALRTVYGNTISENGWPMVDQGSCEWITVPGTNPPVHLQIQQGIPAALLGAWAADINAYVQPLRDADSACWTATNSVGTSNHLSGTAEDLDWNDHPMGPEYAGWSADQVATIREMLQFYTYKGIQLIWWGEDWDSPKDSMHFQVGYNTFNNQDICNEFIAEFIGPDGFSTFRREAPQPAPAPAPGDAATKALYDAVPVIDMNRAAQLVDAVMAGLAASQCTNVQRIAMWLAQVGYESGGFVYTQEIQPPPGAQYPPYIGRTWIQITWQSNYAKFGQWCVQQGLISDPDQFVNDPSSLADIRWAGLGAAWYWTVERPQINSLCDAGDLVGVTEAINGGTNGLDGVPNSRRERYQQAIALGDELLALLTPTSPPSGGFLMALTDDEQTELLAKTRDIWDQLRGPNAEGWPQLGQNDQGQNLTPIDAIAVIKNTVETPGKA